MEKNEVKSSVKSIYLQAAALASLEVNPKSPERFVELVDKGYEAVKPERRAEAAANVLLLISTTLRIAGQNEKTTLSESDVDAARDKVCPVYPFAD